MRMRTLCLATLFSIVAPMLVATNAAAGPIFDYIERRDSAGATHTNETTGVWSDTVTRTIGNTTSTATQTTDISASFLGGSGAATVSAVNGENTTPVQGTSWTDFQVNFTLDQSYLANLLVNLAAAGGGQVEAWLYSYQLDAQLAERILSNGIDVLAFNGVLDAGQYILYLRGDANAGGGVSTADASFSGGLSLTPFEGAAAVPEPASMTLLGLGLAGVTLKRRRASNNRDAR